MPNHAKTIALSSRFKKKKKKRITSGGGVISYLHESM